jgi:hypothetical protein
LAAGAALAGAALAGAALAAGAVPGVFLETLGPFFLTSIIAGGIPSFVSYAFNNLALRILVRFFQAVVLGLEAGMIHLLLFTYDAFKHRLIFAYSSFL